MKERSVEGRKLSLAIAFKGKKRTLGAKLLWVQLRMSPDSLHIVRKAAWTDLIPECRAGDTEGDRTCPEHRSSLCKEQMASLGSGGT